MAIEILSVISISESLASAFGKSTILVFELVVSDHCLIFSGEEISGIQFSPHCSHAPCAICLHFFNLEFE